VKPEPVFPKYEGYLSDESHLPGRADAIVFPENAAELSEAMRQAARDGTRVTVQGARTGLAGGAVPQGGLIVSLTRMNEAPELAWSGACAQLHAQAGVTLEQIEAEAASCGLVFPPDPTEGTATIGGAYATGASGMGGLRFGRMSRFVEGLSWVTPPGEIWRVGRGEYCFDDTGCMLPDGRRLEGSLAGMGAGCDLIDFLCGSEGRLGVAADFRLRLLPEHAQRWGVVFFFPDDGAALAFARRLYGRLESQPEPLFACEYFNHCALGLIAAGGESGDPRAALPAFPKSARAALYAELRGDDAAALESMLMALLELLAGAGGSGEDTWAQNGPGVKKLRKMRHRLAEAIHSRPGAREGGMRLNACFSAAPERFAECLDAYRKGLAQSGLDGALYGHLFENRLHVSLHARGENERESCVELLRGFAGVAERFGGLRAPEYGEGKLPRPWDDTASRRRREERMRALAAFFDPSGLMGG